MAKSIVARKNNARTTTSHRSKAKEVSAAPAHHRPLPAIEAEIATVRERMEADFRRAAPAIPRLGLLEKERKEHPDTALKALESLRLGEDRRAPAAKADAPELGRILCGIAERLEAVEACAETVSYALGNDGCPSSALITTLQSGVLDRLQEEVKALRGAVSGARIKDGLMVVTREPGAAEQQSS